MRVRGKVTPGAGAVVGPRPVAKVAKSSAAGSVAKTEDVSHADPVDTASFLGLSETELSPTVRIALQTLLEEVSRLREELQRTRKRINHLERLADEDAMLPIANRRAFVRELTRLISYSERYGSPGSVLYFDLNGMKIIKPTPKLAADMKQVGAIMLADWLKRAGPDGKAVVDAYRKM